MMNHLVTILTVLVFSVQSFSQTQREIYNQSTEAYKSKNYSQFLKLTQKLDSLRPSHPTYTYNLAAAYSLINDSNKAILTLKRLILMNNRVDFEKDADFDNIKNTTVFEKLVVLKAALEKPVRNSEKVISLTEKDLHPESLIYLNKQKIWLASSIRKKKIVSFDVKTGKCTDWFTNSEFSVFAMKSDSKSKYLWVATGAMPEMIGYSKEMNGKSEVLKIDIKSKKIVKRFPVEGNHVFGDLILDKKGDVYVSDSGEALVYKISDDKLSICLDLKAEAFNLQGIAFNDDQSKLFIADYLKGILVVNTQNLTDRNWLEFSENSTPKGIDGLVFHENSLFAIHNGVKPIRLMQYRLNNALNTIEEIKIMDINRSEFDEPALATLVNGKLYFFANSPWKAYDKEGNLDVSKFENPILFQYPLQ